MKLAMMVNSDLGDMSKPFLSDNPKHVNEIKISLAISEAEITNGAVNLINNEKFNEKFVVLERKFFLGLLKGFKGI